MSSIARFTYVNELVVKPFLAYDSLSGVTTYGPEYTIMCDFQSSSEQAVSNDGAEFISRHIIYTEDPRLKFLDKVLLPVAGALWEQVRSHTMWPMGAFNDTPDYKAVT